MAVLLAIGFPLFTIPRLEGIHPGFSFVLVAAVGLFFYFLPSIVAGYRRETNYLAVLAANLLLGWNLIAWFLTLLFAVYGQTQAQAKARLLARQRLLTAFGGNPILTGHPHDPEPKQRPEDQDPRGTVAVLLFTAALLAFVAVGGLSNGLTGSSSPAMRIINAVMTSSDVSAPDELTSRATFQDIINACGQPERHWITSSGEGTSMQTVDHLLYSRVPAEIRLAIRPNENREQSRHWTFAGAALSPDSTSTYSGQQLKTRMPCMSQWADALAARETQNLKGNIH